MSLPETQTVSRQAEQETKLNWKNYDWLRAEAPNPAVRIWRVTEEVELTEPDYVPDVNKFARIVSQGLDTVGQTFPGLFLPTIDVAVFPTANFRTKLGLGDNIPLWVRGCVRDNVICYEHSFSGELAESLFECPAERKRGLVHELLHPFLDKNLGYDLPTALDEGFVETVPRFVLGYQAELPESTNYLLSSLPSQLVRPCDINENGLFPYSQSPISENCAYMSSLVYVLGIALSLSADVKSGVLQMIDIARAGGSFDQFMSDLGQKLGIDRRELDEGKQLQLKGIGYVAAI